LIYLQNLLKINLFQDLNSLNKKDNKHTNPDALPKDFYLRYHSNNKSNINISHRSTNGGTNLILNLNKFQLGGRLTHTTNIVQPEFYKSLNVHKRILGHLSAVYCVCFDRSGRYILTGADDSLIKAWCAREGRLLATFRGHEKEISDIDINYENTLLASGSCDKSIRIWNLNSTASINILQGHSSMVTSVEFSPYNEKNSTARWLASSGSDAIICFWQWDSETFHFNPKPRKFTEKSRPGAQILCLSFSSGGAFMAAGSNDHLIRVYHFENNEPSRIAEIDSHNSLVDSILFSNHSSRFLSGSKDGTAKIWTYDTQKWKSILLDTSKTFQKPALEELASLDVHRKHSVTMVAWNRDDSLVISAQNNNFIKVWNSSNGNLVHELKGHSNEIFVLESHPNDPRLLFSAGHDGNIMVWNLLTGKMLKKFYNRVNFILNF
jgi:WD40 repeat protein